MLTGPTQHLQVHLPSPTTVSLTVTTRRQYTSKLQLRLLTLLQHAFRVVLVYHVLLVAVAKGQDNLVSRPPADGDGDGRGAFDVYADFCLRASLGGSVARLVAQAVGWWVLAPLALAAVYLCLRRGYVGECCPSMVNGMAWSFQRPLDDARIWRLTIHVSDVVEESLLVLQGLGIQTSTSSPYYFLSATTTFIPTTQIQDIVIHEAFKGLEVRFYLAVIVQGATEVVVVFPVRAINDMYQSLSSCLTVWTILY